jgi:hypothetical protein
MTPDANKQRSAIASERVERTSMPNPAARSRNKSTHSMVRHGVRPMVKAKFYPDLIQSHCGRERRAETRFLPQGDCIRLRFASPDEMCSAFQRKLGVIPLRYRERFQILS